MKQPDTAALRERLAHYTPEEEQRQDREELEGLLREVKEQTAEMRSLLKEINAVKNELYDIHNSLKHTAVREQAAFKALEAAKESANNIVDGISHAIVKAEKNTVIQAKVSTDELAKVEQCSAKHIKAEKELLEEHRNEMVKHLHNSGGIWLSNRWFTILIVVYGLCYWGVALWAILKG